MGLSGSLGTSQLADTLLNGSVLLILLDRTRVLRRAHGRDRENARENTAPSANISTVSYCGNNEVDLHEHSASHRGEYSAMNR